MKLTEKDNPVVMGYTLSSDFPNPFNFSISGGKEIFVAKFDSSGSILYHTEFLGGSDDDVPYAMVLDSKLNAYLTGYTKSSDFPVNNSSFDQTFNQGTYDAFLAVINVDILKPIADAGPDIVTDEDRVLCFNGSSSHDDESIVNYTWTIRDRFGVSSFYESVTPYNFTSPGLFQVELNVTDIAGNWGTDTALIYVIDRTKPDANAGPDFTVDEDTPAFLFGNRSTDNGMMVSYNWSFRDGVKSVTLSGMNAYYVFEDPGVYSIELNVTDLGGNWDTDIVNITVMDVTRPFADAGPDLHISQGDVAFFNGSGCDDNVMITNYTWSIENEHLYGYLVSYQFQNAGGIPVTLKVTDGSFNWGEDAATIWVRDTEHPVADAGGDRIVEANSMVILNGSASSDNVGITAYRWTVEVEGEQIESEEGVFSHVFANVGLYEITLNVSDSEGNWDVDRVSVRVMDTQKPLASAGSDRIVNEDTSMTFDASGSTDNTGIASWKWTIRDSVYDIDLEGVKVNYTFEEPGLFSAILKVADIAGNTDTVEIEITVLDITDPIPDLRCDPEIDQGVRWNYDGSASTDNVGIANWTWTVEGNSEVIRLYGKSGYLFFPYPGSYHVTMTVTDEAGNSGSISAELKVMDIEPPVARASGINVLTVGSEAIFDGTGSTDNVGIVNWTWVISGGGDNVTLYGMTCRHSFDEPGIYLVTLTVTDGEGARSSDKIRIAVEDDEGIDRGSVKEESSFIPYVAMGILVGIILVLIALLVRRRPEKGSTLADPDTESWE